MARRRRSEIELCFDSMSDLITNLAGGLILVVLLLMGLTREAPEHAGPRPGQKSAAPGSQSPRKLVERLNNLRADLDRVNADIDTSKKELDELDKKATEVLERTKTADPPLKVRPEKKKEVRP